MIEMQRQVADFPLGKWRDICQLINFHSPSRRRRLLHQISVSFRFRFRFRIAGSLDRIGSSGIASSGDPVGIPPGTNEFTVAGGIDSETH